jgi:hypothetical protein
MDLYKDFASAVFNIGYDEVNDTQRFLGKTAQLSLIYGTGAGKLRAQVKQMGGIDIGEAEAKRIVTLYREDYPHVVDAWRQGGKGLDAVYNNLRFTMGHNGVIEFHGAAGAQLPSGLYMRYPDLTKAKTDTGMEWSVLGTHKNSRDKLYGSKVFQGLTQAMARCIIAESMLRVDKVHRVLLTIHDALYIVTPEDQADAALRLVINELRTPPKWMPNIPLDAEGGYGKSLDFKMGKI